ncbi:TniQ family protein [Roseateles flavus]|uniref:TniQ family protein n=1 Tax=Roseateles flavus TaxID=3149041 RepID=A0ABV0GKI2_9BURK
MDAPTLEPLPIVPAWHADETLYSWAARYHRLRGAGAVRPVGGLLFDTLHAYKEIEAPTRLHHFCRATGGALGDVRSILLKRTPLAAFVPFLAAKQRQRFDVLAQSDQPTAWMTMFGMRASALEQRALRWCPDCVREDIATLGMPSWRLTQQLPGSWVCLVHDRPLYKQDVTSAAWHLPPLDIGMAPAPRLLSTGQCWQSMRTLSALASSLVSAPPVDLQAVRRIVVSALHEQRVLSATKPISAARLCAWFGSTPQARGLRCIAGVAPLSEGKWIHETLASRRAAHPIKWMLLLSAAFDGKTDCELIEKLHRPTAKVSWDDQGQGLLWHDDDRRAGRIVRTATAASVTLAHAAAELNVSVGTLRIHLRAASCNASKQRAAQRQVARRASAIREIETFMLEHEACSRRDIYSRCKAATSWLRCHEPAALVALLARKQVCRERQRSLF